MKSKRIITVIAFSVLLILLIFLLLRSCSDGQSSTTPKQSEQKTLDFTPYDYTGDRITIPAVTGINFKANQLTQSVDLSNPAQNACYFRLSLYLSDDTLIWQSDLIAPSETITEITLMQKLDSGLYRNCKLVYDCFDLDDQTPLNSANVQLEINSH